MHTYKVGDKVTLYADWYPNGVKARIVGADPDSQYVDVKVKRKNRSVEDDPYTWSINAYWIDDEGPRIEPRS